MTDSSFANLRSKDFLFIELQSALLISGGPTPGVHAATVRRSNNGLPFLPASALKGALREQLSRLAGEGEAKTIFGGKGVDSRGKKDEDAVAAEIPGGGTARVHISDGHLISNPDLFNSGSAYAVRTQVAIDRHRRRAADNHLFLRETVGPSDNVVFLAEVDLSNLDAQKRDRLRHVAAAVLGVGAGKSTGLGAISMRLLSREELDAKVRQPEDRARVLHLFSPKPVEIPAGQTLELVFQAVDPLCLGTERDQGNFRRSRHDLPASTLRGALITAGLSALGRAHTDQSQDPEFHAAWLDPETCVRFSDARLDVAGPAWPLTLQTCKSHPGHGQIDLLIPNYLRQLAADRRHFAAPDLHCPECQGRLVPWRRAQGQDAERRILTRLGMDRDSGRGKDGQLFSLEVLECGTRFRTTVQGISPAARPLLEAALARDLRVGRGRGQGYGRLRCVHATVKTRDEELLTRLERLDAGVRQKLVALAEHLGCDSAELGADERHFAVWLQSDFLPPEGSPGPEPALLGALGLTGQAQVVAGELRTLVRGGWDALAHRPKVRRPALAAGSVLLLRSPLGLQELVEKLAIFEDRGLGEGRELGFGWVRFSDKVHQPVWTKRTE